MIHTIQLYTNLSFEEKGSIESRFNKNIKEVMKDINNKKQGIKLSGINRACHYQVTVFVDVTKLLNRGNVYEEDYYEVKEKIDEAIEGLVGYSLELTLMRIDYRIDKYINSKAKRLILMHLYKIDCQYKCNTLYLCCIKYLCRCFISETLARSIIYYSNNMVKLLLTYRRKIKLFGIKLS